MHDMIARTTGAEGTSLTAFAITRLVKEVDQPNFTRKGEVRSLRRLQPKCNPRHAGEAGHFVSGHCCPKLATSLVR